ncbi:hypothetical protein [Clostridium aminobutyricum]|uniref:Uncharacterized protein n=1 Tax=Clostridium aminobutyricum TaxID=33953 RepID=A0A939D6N5_CLOAM|nr:hypothetical protein [Clostridium aminobutyricum]MBN7772056.1 hypothetical protein [Clostridium aminobutyricum]
MSNLFAFHGIDHKVGVTMIAQSVAELIAQHNRELNVLLISLNGRKSDEYLREDVKSIDHFKLQLDSKLIVEKDFMRECRYKDNLYVLGGIANEQEERYYFPETVKYLITSIQNGFDIMIADTGSCIDNGLAFGALCVAGKNFLIVTQQESNLKRYEEHIHLFHHAEINFEKILINHYQEDDPYNLSYITQRIEVDKEKLCKIQASNFSRQAEIEHKTFIDFKFDKYTDDIKNISNQVLAGSGLPTIQPQRRGKWKNFI